MSLPSCAGRCISVVGRIVSPAEVVSFMRQKWPLDFEGVQDRYILPIAIDEGIAVEFDGKLFLNEEVVNG